MPDMDGGEVATAMRADPQLASVPIVMLTSVDQTQDGKAFRSLAIQAQLTKPARSSLLLETIISVLEESAAEKDKPHLLAEVAVGRDGGPGLVSIAPTEPAPEEQTSAVTGAPDGRCEILVAEDNEVNQIVFAQILAGTGRTFRIVDNGAKAVEVYRNDRPKIILMDVSMPVMNGHEATREIRRLEAASGSHTPIVGVTAHAIKGDMENCMAAGMDDYVTKPVSPDMLMAKIDKWLGNGEGFVVAKRA
jgi:CheY-like chemotaxis protein